MVLVTFQIFWQSGLWTSQNIHGMFEICPFSSVEAARKRSGSDTSKTNLPSTDSNAAVVVPDSGCVELLAALED